MNELERLARAVEAERPPIPAELLRAQRDRLMGDPRARVMVRRRSPAVIGAGLSLVLAVAALLFAIRGERDGINRLEGRGTTAGDETGGSEQRLGDGTQIRLAASARGKLTESGAHEVRFNLDQGRADFDVAPNPHRTFLVVAGLYEVRVLGTRFSVDYEPGRGLRVSVRQGVVSVVSPDGRVSRLEPGDRLEVSDDRSREEPTQPRPATPVEVEPSSVIADPERALLVSPAELEAHRTAKHHASNADSPSAAWRSELQSGNYSGALRAARRLDLDRLAAELGPAELADLADAARLGGDAPAALKLLHALDDRFPDAEQGARAIFLLGRLLQRQAEPMQAMAAFERYLAHHPQGTYTNEALGRLMEVCEATGDAARATSAAQSYLARDPNGPYRRLARSLLRTR